MKILAHRIPQFYVLEFNVVRAEVKFSKYRQWECSACGLYRGPRIGHTAVRFSKKSEFADIVPTAFGVLARTVVVERLLDAELSGWRQGRVDVSLTSRVASMPSDYSELVVVGHTNNYAARARLRVAFECPACGRKQYERPEHGLSMPVECWDKSDFFLLEELGFTIVTDRVKDVFDEYHFSGAQLTPVADWHDPDYMLRRKLR